MSTTSMPTSTDPVTQANDTAAMLAANTRAQGIIAAAQSANSLATGAYKAIAESASEVGGSAGNHKALN
jgi:hypothetical protein